MTAKPEKGDQVTAYGLNAMVTKARSGADGERVEVQTANDTSICAEPDRVHLR